MSRILEGGAGLTEVLVCLRPTSLLWQASRPGLKLSAVWRRSLAGHYDVNEIQHRPCTCAQASHLPNCCRCWCCCHHSCGTHVAVGRLIAPRAPLPAVCAFCFNFVAIMHAKVQCFVGIFTRCCCLFLPLSLGILLRALHRRVPCLHSVPRPS